MNKLWILIWTAVVVAALYVAGNTYARVQPSVIVANAGIGAT